MKLQVNLEENKNLKSAQSTRVAL